MYRINSEYNRLIGAVIGLLFSISSINPGIVFAQSVDEESPVIIHNAIDSGKRGEVQEFVAEVTDNVGVAKVILYYRFRGASDYTSVEMEKQSDKRYVVSVDTTKESISLIEYYLEAVDESGQISLRGFSFEPLKRWLDPEGARGTDVVDTPKKSKTLWYVLGGVAVLALAGLAGRSEGGEPTPATETHTLNLTVGTP